MKVKYAGAEGQAPHSVSLSLPSLVLDISGYFRETIRQDIRQARERFSGQQLRQELARLQRRLDSVELLSPDIIMNLLLSYRDVQVGAVQRPWARTRFQCSSGTARKSRSQRSSCHKQI